MGFRGDLLDCAVDDLPSQQPALTLVGGRAVYDPDGLLGSPWPHDTPVALSLAGGEGCPCSTTGTTRHAQASAVLRRCHYA